MEEKDEDASILSNVIIVILIIGAVYLLFDRKPKTERVQEVMKEIKSKNE